jgi:hypothetical protein
MPIFTLFVPTLTDAHLHADAAEGTTVLQERASSVCGMGSRLHWRWSEEVENSASAAFKEQSSFPWMMREFCPGWFL